MYLIDDLFGALSSVAPLSMRYRKNTDQLHHRKSNPAFPFIEVLVSENFESTLLICWIEASICVVDCEDCKVILRKRVRVWSAKSQMGFVVVDWARCMYNRQPGTASKPECVTSTERAEASRTQNVEHSLVYQSRAQELI